MARRITKATVMVEDLPAAKRRITKTAVQVEEKYQRKTRFTKAVIMVEYTVENWRHTSYPAQLV